MRQIIILLIICTCLFISCKKCQCVTEINMKKLEFISECNRDNGVWFEIDGSLKCLVPPQEKTL